MTSVRKIKGGTSSAYGWRGLSLFHNVNLTKDKIIAKHNPPSSQIKNVVKQAKQIRYCLLQAREYHEAAKNVSMATKPLLLYYSCMSLALAEVLWKQSGNSSLDAARGEHGHHGLELLLVEDEKRLARLDGGLIAKPHIIQKRRGTFELWHRTATYGHLVGVLKRIHPNGGEVVGSEILFRADEARMPLLPENGIDLLYCAKRLPSIAEHIHSLGIAPELVRCTISATDNLESGSYAFSIIAHPGNSNLIHRVLDGIKMPASAHQAVQIREYLSGFAVHIVEESENPIHLILLEGFSIDEKYVLLCPDKPPLNEFGLFYICLYVSGMYSRYYPEKWMLDLEEGSMLSSLITLIVEAASERLPLITLGEFTNETFISV